MQEQGGECRVIYYASRSSTDAERRYSQTEKEALAIVWVCERLHPICMGFSLKLLTDHKPLEFIYSPKSKPCARIEHLVLRMQQYTYTVRWIPGNSSISDSLSRYRKSQRKLLIAMLTVSIFVLSLKRLLLKQIAPKK